MKKKILQIGYSGLGGVSDLMVCLAKHDKLYQHILIFYGIESLPEWLQDECKFNNIPSHVFRKKPGISISTLKNIAEVVKRYQPDYIITHGFDHILFRLFYKVKIPIFNLEHQNFSIQHKYWYLKALLMNKYITAHLFLTEESNLSARKIYPRIYKSKLTKFIVSNPVDDLFFEEYEKSKEKPKQLLMVSRLISSKDYITVLKVIGQLNASDPFIFKIAGDGPEKIKIEKLIIRLHLEKQVILCGVLPKKDIVKEMQKSWAYIHSSQGETLALSILQAWATGTPVIASNVSGINNLITNGENGLLFDYKNEKQLLKNIQLLNSDTALYKRISEKCKESALKYRSEIVVEKYHTILKRF